VLPAPTQPRRTRTWLLVALLACALISPLLPASTPAAVAFLLAEAQVAFAVIHLATWTRWRTAFAALGIVFTVSYASEWLGVHTGLVFGDYTYSETALGPLVSGVPPLVMLAYFAIGYASFMIARIIVTGGKNAYTERITGARLVLVAVIAGLIATLNDLAFDPINSTLLQQWVWHDGGPYFGVPPHNFYGWWATVTAYSLILGWLLNKQPPRHGPEIRASFMAMPVALYAIFAATIIINGLQSHANGTNTYQAMALVASLVMTLPILTSIALLTRPEKPRTQTPTID